MKHGTLVQKKRRAYKRIEKIRNGWDWDPWSEEMTWGRMYDYKYVPDGWHYYGPVFRYRYDPVPGVKHWRNSVRPYVRHMKTTQERRWACAHKEYVRGRRSCCNLPNTWDDYWHSRRGKGWKRTKKKRQWMQKGDKLYAKTNWNLQTPERGLLVD